MGRNGSSSETEEQDQRRKVDTAREGEERLLSESFVHLHCAQGKELWEQGSTGIGHLVKQRQASQFQTEQPEIYSAQPATYTSH